MLALLFDGSFDVGLGEPGTIHEEIHHFGGITQILKVSDGVHAHVLKVQVSFFF